MPFTYNVTTYSILVSHAFLHADLHPLLMYALHLRAYRYSVHCGIRGTLCGG